MIWEDLKDTLIIPNLEASTFEDIMEQVEGILIKGKCAKLCYIEALIKKEKEFPTKNINGVRVAILT